MHNAGPPDPSISCRKSMSAGSSGPAGDNTIAPAPSPNRTQLVRSFQSRMREKVSAPITSAHFDCPARMKLSTVASA
jgi:hypothetical protein